MLCLKNMRLDESLVRSIVGGGSSESCHRQGQTTLAVHNLAVQTVQEHFKLGLCGSFLHLKVSVQHPVVSLLHCGPSLPSVTKC